MRSLSGFSLTVLALLAAAPGVASASDDSLTRTTTVRISDLDLTRAEGIQTLDARIKAAVNRVCHPDDFTLHANLLAGECRHQAMKGAVAQRNVVIARAETRSRGVAVAANSGQ